MTPKHPNLISNWSIRLPISAILLATALLLPNLGNAFKHGQGYMVRGGIGCATFLAQYQHNLQNRIGDDMITMEFSQTHGWIKGYLTAYNAWVKNGLLDVSAGFDADDLEGWVAKYCGENPEADLPDALKAFVNQSLQGNSRPSSERGI